MSFTNQTRLLRAVVTLDKGKPPAQQPYFGPDAEVYLTPEFLRRNAEGDLVKASANAVRVSDGETVILWDGSNAGEIFRARSGVLASTMSRARHADAFDRDYFFYALKNWENYLKGQTSGSGIPHVDKEVLGKLELYEFPKPEQTKIAEILSTVDRAIEQTEALIAKQQRIKAGLMQDLLTRGIDEHGNLRSEETHQFKDSPLGRIPIEWEVEELSECYAEPARNGLYKPKEYYGSGNRMVHMPQMFRGLTVDVSSAVRVAVDHSEMDRFGLKTQDLLIARRSLVLEGAGRCSLVPEIKEPTTFESSIIRVRLEQNKLDATYTNFFLNSEAGYRMRLPFIRQVAVSGVAGEDVGQFQVPIPDPDEQCRIINCFESSEAVISNMIAAVGKLKRQKIGLMQDLLTGKVRVTTLLSEPQEASA